MCKLSRVSPGVHNVLHAGKLPPVPSAELPVMLAPLSAAICTRWRR